MRNILTVSREHINEQKTPKDYGWVGFISDFDERQYAKKAFKLELVSRPPPYMVIVSFWDHQWMGQRRT